MDGVHFPKGYQLNAINFGETGGVAKSEVLRGFADSLSEILDGMDTRLSMVVLASDITSPNGFTYGSDSALELFDCKIYLDLTEEEEPAAAVAEILADKAGDFGVMLFDSGDTAELLETVKDLGAKSWFIRSWAEEYPLA